MILPIVLLIVLAVFIGYLIKWLSGKDQQN
jgi:hypothetical protein